MCTICNNIKKYHFALFFSVLFLISCDKGVDVELKKSAAEKLTFTMCSKSFSAGHFTTFDIWSNIKGKKYNYYLKSIEVTPKNVVRAVKEDEGYFSLYFKQVGSFTATIVLEHPRKKDATIQNASFKITKMVAPPLAFSKITKSFNKKGSISTAEILTGVQGSKTGYTVKNITNITPANFVTVNPATKSLIFNGKVGKFTATIILEHPTKKDATLTNTQFEITKTKSETLTFTKRTKAFTNRGRFTTAEILGGVQGNKAGYTVKNITAINPADVVSVNGFPPNVYLNMNNTHTFTATIIL